MTAQNNMRIYQNGKQIIVNAGVETYSLGLNQWSLGSTTTSKSAGGLYDEFVVENYAMRPDGVNEYYKSNLTSLSITVDFANKHQTIRNFGASDAWDADVLGKYWPEEKRIGSRNCFSAKNLITKEILRGSDCLAGGLISVRGLRSRAKKAK